MFLLLLRTSIVLFATFTHATSQVQTKDGVRAAFVWGSATAAYQVEGFRNVSGRQPSVWDCFDTDMQSANGVDCVSIRSTKPDGTVNVFEGENAQDSDMDYEYYSQTIDSLKDHGFGAYRMSISWTRVLSYTDDGKGGLTVTENKEGIKHYHEVLSSLVARDLSIALTMWHWDTPQAIENAAHSNPDCIYGLSKTGSTWLCGKGSSNDIAEHFRVYAKLLLREYGQYVDYWITLNEPLTLIMNGYSRTAMAPSRCNNRRECFDGDEAVEPFVATHNLLRAHAVGFQEWASSPSKKATSSCGLVLNGDFSIPLTDSDEDKAAAQRDMEYQMAIFFDPIYLGTWPGSVMAGVGGALPFLDPIIFGTHTNIYFMNHYTSHYTYDDPSTNATGYYRTSKIGATGYKEGIPIGLPSSNGWLYSYAPGIAANQNWLHNRYPKVSFIVTENGWGNVSASKEQDVKDLTRCNYYRSYIGNMSANAYVNNISILGYFAWSIMDNYEWADGFATRFGLTYVDFTTNERTPKLSLTWFKGITMQFPSLPAEGQEAFPTCESVLEEMDEKTETKMRHLQANGYLKDLLL